ncbi:unnamed protein product, partial [Amoebophrya sp. A25]
RIVTCEFQTPAEGSGKQDISKTQLVLLQPATGRSSEFAGFDTLLDSSVDPDDPFHCNQRTCYERLGLPLLKQVFRGYSTSLFAYGQTGSGKTTSVMGGSVRETEQWGIIPRLLEDLFIRLRELEERDPRAAPRDSHGSFPPGTSAVVKCSVIEVYNERLRDLLHPAAAGGGAPKIDVRCHPQLGNYVP